MGMSSWVHVEGFRDFLEEGQWKAKLSMTPI